MLDSHLVYNVSSQIAASVSNACCHLCMCFSADLVQSGGWGRQDGPTEFLHGADGSREGWSGKQRRHQVNPEDPRHHLVLAPGERETETEKEKNAKSGWMQRIKKIKQTNLIYVFMVLFYFSRQQWQQPTNQTIKIIANIHLVILYTYIHDWNILNLKNISTQNDPKVITQHDNSFRVWRHGESQYERELFSVSEQ